MVPEAGLCRFFKKVCDSTYPAITSSVLPLCSWKCRAACVNRAAAVCCVATGLGQVQFPPHRLSALSRSFMGHWTHRGWKDQICIRLVAQSPTGLLLISSICLSNIKTQLLTVLSSRTAVFPECENLKYLKGFFSI